MGLNKVIKLLVAKNQLIAKCSVLILGITFKENCSDIRNSKVIDIINELKQFGTTVDVYDPIANFAEVKKQFDIELLEEINKSYDAIILAVAHSDFKKLELTKFSKGKKTVVYDIKSFLDRSLIDDRL